jgi:hypothetical protein
MATTTTTTQVGEKGSEKRVEDSQQIEYFDEKKENGSVTDSDVREEAKPKKDRLQSARDLVTEVLLVEDDPTVNPWTFRMWFIGIGLSVFGGYVERYLHANADVVRTVTTINTFKPQSIHIHLVFVAVITYIIGLAMANILPNKGKIGRIINPGPVSSPPLRFCG